MIMSWAFSLLNPETGGRKPSQEDEDDARDKADISFSPMAMPLLSGPGSIAVVIGFASQDLTVTNYIMITVAIFFCALGAFVALRIAPQISKFLGKSGMAGFARMMGFIALAIGVQVYHQRHYAPSWRPTKRLVESHYTHIRRQLTGSRRG